MKVDLLQLFEKVAYECDLDPSTLRYCKQRIKNEGYKFLTVTLPKLSKAVLVSLEKGYFVRPTDFAWKGGALRYFRVILERIFDLSTGVVLTEVDALAIYRLRQICEYFYKLALPYSEEDIVAQTNAFKSVEKQLSAPYDKKVADQARKDLVTYLPEVANSEVSDVFVNHPMRPGPGTFAGKSEYKKEWYARKYLDDSVDPAFRAYSGYGRYSGCAKGPRLTDDPHTYSEVLFVPKDSRGPRVISREPFCRLKAQMAFFDWLSHNLESRTNIRFRDQQPNRCAALSSSINRRYATVDLKEASDRVRFDVSLHVFRNCPAVMYFLLNGRTKVAKLPSGELITLKKVAGMGSGLTFPLMSLLIYLVTVRSIADHLRIPFTKAQSLVHVYGDDLILPVTCYEKVVRSLESIGLMVNLEKSFTRSHFRESCGGDFYYGQDVTPTRLKLQNCSLNAKGTKLTIGGSLSYLSTERHCRELVKAGLLSAAEYLYKKLESCLGQLPMVGGESSVLGRYTLNEKDVRDKMQMDSSGLYTRVKGVVPLPVVDKKVSLDHDHVLGYSLRPKRHCWADRVFPKGSSNHECNVPREVAYRYSKLSHLALI